MFVTRNALPEKIRAQICGLLQVHLSNSIDLACQAKQAHWNVKGPEFMPLHGLFDQVASDSVEYTDLIAERIVQLGGFSDGTIKSVAKRTELPDYPITIRTGHEHINAMAHALASYGEGVRNAIGKADEINDQDTADLLTQISRGIDRSLWFVEAHTQSKT